MFVFRGRSGSVHNVNVHCALLGGREIQHRVPTDSVFCGHTVKYLQAIYIYLKFYVSKLGRGASLSYVDWVFSSEF